MTNVSMFKLNEHLPLKTKFVRGLHYCSIFSLKKKHNFKLISRKTKDFYLKGGFGVLGENDILIIEDVTK